MTGALHLAQVLHERSLSHPLRTGLLAKKNGRWIKTGWKEVWEKTLQTAAAFRALGLSAGDRVAIWSENRPEWLWADMAALSLGAVSVPVYLTLGDTEILHILRDSGSRLLCAANPRLIGKISRILSGTPALSDVVLFEGPPPREGLRSHLLADLAGPVSSGLRGEILRRIGEDHRETPATIIYTSGTTGLPKGVVLTHGNFLANLAAVNAAIPLTDRDVHLSFLPLSHVFERLGGYYLPLEHGATIAYAESFDRVPENIREVRPTILLAVPRFYEKFRSGILEKVRTGGRLTRALFDLAIRAGEALLRRGGRPAGPLLSAKRAFLKLLVFGKIRRGFGGRLRFGVSGGAPLPEETARFFYSLGILVLEGYGLTETSPVISANRPGAFRFGTVGRPLDGIEVRIAQDGEVLTKSPCVMKGYHNLDAATREVIRDGWFHTGDIGEIDGDGFLKITGRKKEIIITSGGKKISTRLVESAFEKNPLITRCVLFGDGRNFLTALIVPDFDALRHLAREKGIACCAGPSEIICSEWARAAVQQAIDKTHAHLAPFEQIKNFEMLDRDFCVEEGELTPTLKLRRSVIFKKYGERLARFYDSAG